jgi:hypothetical protein
MLLEELTVPARPRTEFQQRACMLLLEQRQEVATFLDFPSLRGGAVTLVRLPVIGLT